MGTISGIAIGVTLATPITLFVTQLLEKASDKIVEYAPTVLDQIVEKIPKAVEAVT